MKKNRWKAMAALAAAAVLALSACGNSGEDGSTQAAASADAGDAAAWVLPCSPEYPGSRIRRRRGCSCRSAHRNRGRFRRGWKK